MHTFGGRAQFASTEEKPGGGRAATSNPPSQTGPASSLENICLAQHHSGRNGVGATRMYVCVFLYMSACMHSCMHVPIHVFTYAGIALGGSSNMLSLVTSGGED